MLELDFIQQLGEMQLQVHQTLPTKGITALFGVSGAGKTSLINVIAGLEHPTSGRIVLNGKVFVDTAQRYSLPPEKRRIGYVFQDAKLFPHYRVEGNLRYGMAPSMQEHFDAIVTLLGIEPLLSRFPLNLSGGEKQRVAIGRALLTAPELMLMDEPLASLDLLRKRELLPYLERLAHEFNIPILYVTHNMEEILRLADNILLLQQGKVIACGDLESVWASSVLRPWWQKEERNSVLKAEVLEQHPTYPMTALRLGQQQLWVNRLTNPIGSKVRISICADDVSLVLSPPVDSSIRNVLAAEVAECLSVADRTEVKLSVAEHTLWAQITPWARDELNITPGQRLYAQIKSVSINQGNE